MTKPDRFNRAGPKFPQPPKLPAVPRHSVPTRGGVSFRPLAGPDIAIPLGSDADEEREQFYLHWRDTGEYEGVQYSANGSLPEFVTLQYLVDKRKQQPGIDFQYQSDFAGGRTQFGGFVLDFYFPIRAEAWRIQGNFFHQLQAADRARDKIGRLLLTDRGLKVLDLWEDDLLTRPDFVLDLAWYQSGESQYRKEP